MASFLTVIMKMELFRNRSGLSKKSSKTSLKQPPRPERSTASEISQEEDEENSSMTEGTPTQDAVSLASDPEKADGRIQNSVASPSEASVDIILDSDDDSAAIFMDEEEDENCHEIRSRTWDESYSNGNRAHGSPGAASLPGPRGSPSAEELEYAAMAVASSALCSGPAKIAPVNLLEHASDSDDSPATRRRSDGSNMSSDDDDDAASRDDTKEDDTDNSSEDYTDDEDEGEDGYKPGGYHPVKLGEVYNQRYAIGFVRCSCWICVCFSLVLYW